MAKTDLIRKIREHILSAFDSIQSTKPATILFMDRVTLSLVSFALSYSEAVSRRIFLVKSLESDFDSLSPSLPHISAIFFIRPLQKNIDKMMSILSSAEIAETHLIFTRKPDERLLIRMAELDANESIASVVWRPIQFYPAGRNAFTTFAEESNSFDCFIGPSISEKQLLKDDVNAVIQFLILSRSIPLIRYHSLSDISLTFANEIKTQCIKAQMTGSENTTLLILDRRADPLTPLVFPWTYEAMVHEILGGSKGVVDIKVTGNKKERVALDCQRDSFFQEHRYSDFARLGIAASEKAQKFSSSSKSIQDMKALVESCPKMLDESESLRRHVDIISMLSSAVKERNLMDLSALEQEIVCGVALKAATAFEKIREAISNEKHDDEDIMRLCVIFSLRFPFCSEVGRLKMLLRRKKVERRYLIDKVQSFLLGKDVLQRKGILNKSVRTIQHAIKGVDNIYTQHKPFLFGILEQLLSNRLPLKDYPIFDSVQGVPSHKRILVYLLGGCTFSEICCVDRINESPEVEVVLGAKSILNSKLFLKALTTV